jgi:SET domain-containing protein
LKEICDEEANRRGFIYDNVKNCSYLFDLAKDRVIDATRQGNKIKFANHDSKDPNCVPKISNISTGEWSIGLYAKKRIHPGEELFFDYGNQQKFQPLPRPPKSFVDSYFQDDSPRKKQKKVHHRPQRSTSAFTK